MRNYMTLKPTNLGKHLIVDSGCCLNRTCRRARDGAGIGRAIAQSSTGFCSGSVRDPREGSS